MIDFNSWAVEARWVMLVFPFLFSLAGCAVSAFVAFTKRFEVACSSIQSNPGLEQMKNFWGCGSFRARWLLISFISGILMLPSIHLSRGHLSAEELKAFPPELKRALIISAWLTIIGFVWMAVTYGLIRLSEVD